MVVVNVVDHRTNKHCIDIQAVFENACHDNSVAGATQFPKREDYVCFGVGKTTIERAIQYANEKWSWPITLYMYDVTSRNHCDITSI